MGPAIRLWDPGSRWSGIGGRRLGWVGRRDEAGRVSRGWAGPGADADCGAGPRPASIVCALAGQLPCFCFCLCGSCVVSVCRSYVLSLVCACVHCSRLSC